MRLFLGALIGALVHVRTSSRLYLTGLPLPLDAPDALDAHALLPSLHSKHPRRLVAVREPSIIPLQTCRLPVGRADGQSLVPRTAIPHRAATAAPVVQLAVPSRGVVFYLFIYYCCYHYVVGRGQLNSQSSRVSIHA